MAIYRNERDEGFTIISDPGKAISYSAAALDRHHRAVFDAQEKADRIARELARPLKYISPPDWMSKEAILAVSKANVSRMMRVEAEVQHALHTGRIDLTNGITNDITSATALSPGVSVATGDYFSNSTFNYGVYSGVDYGVVNAPGSLFNSPFTSGATPMITGTKQVVVCGAVVVECDTPEKASAKAAELAHQHQQDAYILKPVSKTAPKRDVVVTDL